MQATNSRLLLSPSDLNDYVECAHLTTLALEVARSVRRRPHVPDDHGELLRRKGEEHEATYLAELRARGRQVVDVIGADRWDFDSSARSTIDAMRAGAEIIYQATFVLGDWRGRADFLERVEQPTALGAWGYEALDAKLARAEKPTYVLQLCFYTEAIASIQQVTPSAMHVLLGIGERRTLRHADFAAYSAARRRPSRTRWSTARCVSSATCAKSDGSRKITWRWWPGSAAGRSRDCGRLVSGRWRSSPSRRCRRSPTSLLARLRPFTTRLGCSYAGGPAVISTGTRCPSSRDAASTGCPGPRRATSSSTSRAIRSGSRPAVYISFSAC